MVKLTILLAHLGELPYDSFVEEEKGLKAYILSKDFDKAVLEVLCAGALHILHLDTAAVPGVSILVCSRQA